MFRVEDDLSVFQDEVIVESERVLDRRVDRDIRSVKRLVALLRLLKYRRDVLLSRFDDRLVSASLE